MGVTALLLIGILILAALGVLYWAMTERRRIELLEGGEEGKAASGGDETSEMKPKEDEEGAHLRKKREKEAHFEEEPVDGSKAEETPERKEEDEAKVEEKKDEDKASEEGQFDVIDLPQIHENPKTIDDSRRALE